MSLLFALTFTRFAMRRSKSDLALALLFAGSVMLSLRLKGFLSLVAVAIIVALVQGVANNRGAITSLLVGSLLVIGVYTVEGNVVAKQISTYTSSDRRPGRDFTQPASGSLTRISRSGSALGGSPAIHRDCTIVQSIISMD